MKGGKQVGKGIGRRIGEESGSGVDRDKESRPKEWMKIMGLGVGRGHLYNMPEIWDGEAPRSL